MDPEHLEAMKEGRTRKAQTDRAHRILEIIESPRASDCKCGIRPDMTDKDLFAICASGTCAEHYICPTMDSVMRSVYNYNH